MKNEIDNSIIKLLKNDFRRDYTTPELMSALGIKNREKVVTSVVRLEERGIIEVSREKGRTKYYRLKEGQ